jgi:hypothetical protein
MESHVDDAANRTIRRPDRIGHAIVAAGLAAMFAASFAGVDRLKFAPLPLTGDGVSSICLLKRLTGVPCPTCGMTRSFCSIGRGEFAAAVRFHPLGPLLYVMFAVAMVRSLAIAVSGRRWLGRAARFLILSIPVLILVGLVVWIVRLGFFFASGEGSAAWRESLLGRLLGSF